jgi:hypothetical protein
MPNHCSRLRRSRLQPEGECRWQAASRTCGASSSPTCHKGVLIMVRFLAGLAVVVALGAAPRAQACSLCATSSGGAGDALAQLSLVLPAGLTLATLTLDAFSVANLAKGERVTKGRMVTGLVLAVVGIAVDALLLWAFWPRTWRGAGRDGDACDVLGAQRRVDRLQRGAAGTARTARASGAAEARLGDRSRLELRAAVKPFTIALGTTSGTR